MLKKYSATKILFIVLFIAFISYGFITRCDDAAIYKYCPAAEHQSGR